MEFSNDMIVCFIESKINPSICTKIIFKLEYFQSIKLKEVLSQKSP